MIYLYTEQKNEEGWIVKNDWYFNMYTGNQALTEQERKIIDEIDHAKVQNDMHIETKYGVGTIRNLSSGCKTLLNVIKNPDKIVNVDECGKNVLDILFSMDDIHIYMSRPERIDITEDTQICFNIVDYVLGRKGYEIWWTDEYKRREEDDL